MDTLALDPRLRANARVVEVATASAIRPDPHVNVSEWAEEYRYVPPEASPRPGPWRNATAPYLTEIMDALSPHDPCEEVVCIKCSQSGGSALGENWLGFIMHRAPGPCMYIQATIKAAKDWKVEKLDPMIRATAVLDPDRGGVVHPQKTRSGDGTTSERINCKGGFILLAGANSAASLRQHTIRYLFKDDLDAWEDDADGEGDPDKLADQRIKTFRSLGMSKTFSNSSPTLKGISRVEWKYEHSDKRRFYLGCPHCGALTDFEWEDVQKADEYPFDCHVVCPSCTADLRERDKADMLRSGRWIATAADAHGEVPPKTIPADTVDAWAQREVSPLVRGYWITGVINAFDRWDTIAQQERDAGDDPEKRQTFENTVLGRAYEAKGDAPPWENLSARRETDWRRGETPGRALYFTLAVDVQSDGLYWEIVGWAPGKESWTLDHGFLAGTTDAPLEGAWPKLDRLAERGVRLVSGARAGLDLIGVDAGYNAEAVYQWVRRRPNALALKGAEGWSKPAIYRAETPDVKTRGLSAGKARKFGLKVWLVGTWSLKKALMIYLAREPKEVTERGFPTGYCHFPADAEEEYFRHLVAEYVATEKGKDGAPRRVWRRKGPNHWLDCRVYGLALTHHAGLWAWPEERWDERAAELAGLQPAPQSDLFEAGGGYGAGAVSLADAEGDDEGEAASQPRAPAPPPSRRGFSGLDRLAELNR